MSSEISRMERCTGRFLSRMKMTMPNARPKTQKSRPIMRRRCPSTPRKETVERSGSLRAASPPASSVDWASAWPTVRRSRGERVAAIRARRCFAKQCFANQCPTDTKLTFIVRMKILLTDPSGVTTCDLLRRIDRPLEDLIRREEGCRRFPITLPPPGIINKEDCRFGRVGKYRESICRPTSAHTPGHEALVYSTLPEAGSMMKVIEMMRIGSTGDRVIEKPRP